MKYLKLLLSACLAIYVVFFAYDVLVPKRSARKSGFYYLRIPDSPHVSHPTLELDYTANDTAYLNWYWDPKQKQ